MGAIALYARAGAHFDERVAHAVAMLQSAATEHAGAIVQATSLGAEDMVLTDLIARHQLPIAVGTLDTGKLHAQTLALIPRIEARYGLSIERYAPLQEAVLHFVRRHGEEPMYRSIELRKACCALRKLNPLQRMLSERSAWVTGLRRQQSSNRGGVLFSERDAAGKSKLNPLADWTWGDVWHHIATREMVRAFAQEVLPLLLELEPGGAEVSGAFADLIDAGHKDAPVDELTLARGQPRRHRREVAPRAVLA